MDVVEDFTKEPDHEFICKLINEYFSQKLLQTVDEILNFRKKQVVEVNTDSEYDEEDDTNLEQKQKELSKWEFP